jgi:type IV pilus assembly protein PilM
VSFFGRKSAPILGLDISSTAAKMLELSRSGDRYRVESYSVEPLPPNAVTEKSITEVELVGDAIRRAVKRSASKTKNVAVAVAGTAVITKVITMESDLSDEEMASQIELEADQYIPYSMDEVNMDFEIIGPSEQDPDKVEVLLAASRSDNVDVRVAACELGGLTPKVVDVEAFALESAFGLLAEDLPGSGVGQTIALIDIGATMTTLSVLHDGKIIYGREQLFGGRQLTEEIQRRYGLTYEEAGLAKRQGGLPENYGPEVLEPFKESMGQQVNRSLQFFYSSSQYGQVERIILAGGCAAIQGADQIIAQKTGCEVNIANPFANMSVGGKVRAEHLSNDAPSLLIACGLAMRTVDY